MSSGARSLSLATKSERSANSPPSTSSTAQPEAKTPTSIEFVPVDQSVSSFWKMSAKGTCVTTTLAPVFASYSFPRSSSRPAITGPGRVKSLISTPSYFICAAAVPDANAMPPASASASAPTALLWPMPAVMSLPPIVPPARECARERAWRIVLPAPGRSTGASGVTPQAALLDPANGAPRPQRRFTQPARAPRWRPVRRARSAPRLLGGHPVPRPSAA